MSRTVIGVTGPARGGRSGWVMSWLALRALNVSVRRLRPPFQPVQLSGVRGVVIGGGANIDPGRYAEQSSIEYVYDAQRDEFEWQILHEVARQRLPLLGICRGAQLINVFAGGTLFQNLTEDIPGLELRRSVLASKRITIEPDSVLAGVMLVQEVKVNSLHRQGIRDLGRNLRVSARDADGLVQAIERAPEAGEPLLLGVQWHPEYLPHHGPHRRLFAALVRAAHA